MGCVNGKPVLTEDDLEFIANHTAITRDEVDQQYENFLRKHPDGKIRKKDFRAMMQTCYPNTDTDKLEKHIFRMYDSNGDGYIDFREFMVVLYIMSNGSPEANLKQIFRIFDINGDGSISQKEMVRIVKDLFHLLNNGDYPQQTTGEDIATSAFKEMDINLDGQVRTLAVLPGTKSSFLLNRGTMLATRQESYLVYTLRHLLFDCPVRANLKLIY